MTITLNLEELAQQGFIDSSWVEVLAPVQEVLNQIVLKLNKELAAGHQVFPEPENILRAFKTPFEKVRVVILGQDPYPTPGDAVGLSFSVAAEQLTLPRSLKNIFTELQTDIGCEQPAKGDLQPWVDQGVMLLNRVLTVRAGEAGSHRGIGWEQVTECALTALDGRAGSALVALLWGNDAISAKPFLAETVVIESVHPSPLSASRGFFDSKPFSKVNKALIELGQAPINWALPSNSVLF
ncbi:uracil-DNA glycosylase [Aurantimicrobium minutum]|uniref:uracil-DNA glycosylase n=1 Tax=Aurantimicrobium minutum TaxID=708131 RepID=UPI002473D212|nr:uracil-DNA glycosylase [Aurantimicrobium minutum]MDH6278238.1 uracil-DNA glycosylase [Aurantimicrobium minutum]